MFSRDTMGSTRCRTLFAVFVLASIAAAKDPDYFPLQTGNRWVYRCTRNCLGADTFTLEVAGNPGATAPDGSPYFILRGLAKDFWVRMADGNRLVARDPDGGPEEKLWYDFGAPENQEYQTSVHPCNVSAEITSKNFDFTGPLGRYAGLQIKYPATTCNLQGLVEEIFLPSIGLARRVDLVPGSRTYDLIFARTGGANYTQQSEVSFTLALDAPVYSIGLPGAAPAITARITVKNAMPDPQHPYDFKIRNERGDVIFRWPQGMASTEPGPGAGERSYVIVIPLETNFAQAWPPGAYTAESKLNTAKPDRFAARVPFRIQWVR